MIDDQGLHGKLSPEELVAGWEEHLSTLYGQAQPLPGAEELTIHFHSCGIRQAICTSSSAHAVSKKRAPNQVLFERFSVVRYA